jgi:hypothetical protein
MIILAAAFVIWAAYVQNAADTANAYALSNQTAKVSSLTQLGDANAIALSNQTAKVSVLTQLTEDLAHALANSISDTTTRSNILDATKKFELRDPDFGDVDGLAGTLTNSINTLRADAKNAKDKARSDEVANERRSIATFIPIWKHTMENFTRLLTEFAKKHREVHFLSDYTDFPSAETLCPTELLRQYDNKLPVANISASNSSWNCKCTVWRHNRLYAQPDQPPALIIQCSGSNADSFASITIRDGKLAVLVQDRDLLIINKEFPFSDDSKPLDQLLKQETADQLSCESDLNKSLLTLLALQIDDLLPH